MTPTNYVWPACQDRVPSVWCCPTPHRLVNEGLRGGVWAGWCRWWRGRVGLPPLLQLQACIGPAVDSQLLLHHNKHKATEGPARRSSAPPAPSSRPPPPGPPFHKKKAPAVNFSSVATETELSLLGSECLTAFFSLSPSFFRLSPLSLQPPPFAVFLISSSRSHLPVWNKSAAVSASL